jgi:hypothetical protein
MPLRAALRLEYLGENIVAYNQLAQRQATAMHVPRAVRDLLESGVARPWVARLVGLDARYGFAREWVRGHWDYSHVNSTGSRGIYLIYALSPGLYEVNERTSWRRSRRFYLRVAEDATLREISREEVRQCLQPQRDPASADSASAS